jgi:predicted DNA-binding WGR domain protein
LDAPRKAIAAPPKPAAPAPIITPSSASAKPRYFECVDGTSNKFWEISQSGDTVTTRWGRISSAGQSKTKKFADEKSAVSAASKLIEEKTDEGYVERSN